VSHQLSACRLKEPIVRRLRVFLLICTTILVAASVIAPPSRSQAHGVARACLPTWRVVSSPTLKNSQLSGVAAISARDVWAVGATGENSLIEHWDGTSWRVVDSPGNGAVLSGVSGASSKDVWAVGSLNDGGDSFIEHWNGASWEVTSGPRLVDTGITGGVNALSDVAVISARNAWAVGENGPETLVEHWDGARWTIVASPNGQYVSSLLSVVARSPRDIWAVGESEQYNGGNANQALVEHWDGSRWRLIYSAKQVPAVFTDVTSISGNDVWATGGSGYPASSRLGQWPLLARMPLLVHWDGRRWQVVPSPNPPQSDDHSLAALASLAPNDIWAVGSRHTKQGTKVLIAHWDGRRWKLIQDASLPVGSGLAAITAVSPTDVWAVGHHGDDPLIAHYGCTG
jgi:hypothetical protein